MLLFYQFIAADCSIWHNLNSKKLFKISNIGILLVAYLYRYAVG